MKNNKNRLVAIIVILSATIGLGIMQHMQASDQQSVHKNPPKGIYPGQAESWSTFKSSPIQPGKRIVLPGLRFNPPHRKKIMHSHSDTEQSLHSTAPKKDGMLLIDTQRFSNNTDNAITIISDSGTTTLNAGEHIVLPRRGYFTITYNGQSIDVESTNPYIDIGDNNGTLFVQPRQ